MDVSANGLSFIGKFEGCRLTAYQDSVGVWTIGYGHTSGVKPGDVITQEQAVKYLHDDAAKVVKYLNRDGRSWTQDQFDALVSFGFNCGVGNLKKLISGRTPDQISEAILLYNKAGGKVLAGLTRRRKEEKELFDKGTTRILSNSADAPKIMDAKKNWPSPLIGGHVNTKGGVLRVRAYPGMTSEVIGSIKNGEKVNIHNVSSKQIGNVWWYHIYREDFPYGGFVSGDYISL